MVSDKTAYEVLRRLERVPLLIALTLQHLAKPEGSPAALQAWMGAYLALDTLDNDVGALIDEAREALQREGWVRSSVAVNEGSTPQRG